MLTAISAAAGIIGTVCAAVFGYIAFARGRHQDDKSEGKQDGTLFTEIGYIKSGVDDIKRKQDRQEQRHIEVITRLAAVEESAKQAHKRIDRMEEKT